MIKLVHFLSIQNMLTFSFFMFSENGSLSFWNKFLAFSITCNSAKNVGGVTVVNLYTSSGHA